MQISPFVNFFHQLLTKISHIQESLGYQVAHLGKFRGLICT